MFDDDEFDDDVVYPSFTYEAETIDEVEFDRIYLNEFDVHTGVLTLNYIMKILLRNRSESYTHPAGDICRKIQCRNDSNRSISDIFFICKTYFPEITFKEVLKELHYYNYAHGFFCEDIEKFIYSDYSGSRIRNYDDYTEFSLEGEVAVYNTLLEYFKCK